MADTKISALTLVSAGDAAQEFAVNEAGTSKKMTSAQVKTFANTAPLFTAGTASAGTHPRFAAGTLLTTPEVGAVEYDGTTLHFTNSSANRALLAPSYWRVLDANATGQNVATAQPWFPSLGAVTLLANTCYFFEGAFASARTLGTTPHTTAHIFGGTCTVTAIRWFVNVKEGDAASITDSDLVSSLIFNNTVTIKAASASATENIVYQVWGHIWVSTAGTFIPQFQYSVAPGGAPSIYTGTYFKICPIGSDTFTSMGPWA